MPGQVCFARARHVRWRETSCVGRSAYIAHSHLWAAKRSASSEQLLMFVFEAIIVH